jgi:hypothetical protein
MPGVARRTAALAHTLLPDAAQLQTNPYPPNYLCEARLDRTNLPGMPGPDGLSAVLAKTLLPDAAQLPDGRASTTTMHKPVCTMKNTHQ